METAMLIFPLIIHDRIIVSNVPISRQEIAFNMLRNCFSFISCSVNIKLNQVYFYNPDNSP